MRDGDIEARTMRTLDIGSSDARLWLVPLVQTYLADDIFTGLSQLYTQIEMLID